MGVWGTLRRLWRSREELYNQGLWMYQDFLDSNMYQHIRFVWYFALIYFEALVWATTSLVLLSHVAYRFWPAYIAVCAWVVHAVFSTFYLQVRSVVRVCFLRSD